MLKNGFSLARCEAIQKRKAQLQKSFPTFARAVTPLL
jgi:hypothetical protein